MFAPDAMAGIMKHTMTRSAWLNDRAADQRQQAQHRQAQQPAERASGGRVGGNGPFGVPTYGAMLLPAKKAVSKGFGFGFADGGPVHPVDEILAGLRKRDPVERALSVAHDMINRERQYA